MNAIDKLVGLFDPIAGMRRAVARQQLQKINAAYEAASPSRHRKFRQSSGSINRDVARGAMALRVQARHLAQNHDIARGALRTLVNNVVGSEGIGIEPQPRRTDGTIHEEYATQLREAWRDWCKCPEVTRKHTWSRLQRIAARTWILDGEYFSNQLIGPVQFLDHGTRVPYSLEMMDPDMVPLDYNSGDKIRQGIELNTWGRAVAYHIYRTLPNDLIYGQSSFDLKRVSADTMLHVAQLDRLHQLRGVSEFASVITRLEDIKDYEESERVAAKIAAMMTGYVKKGQPDMYDGGEKDADGNPLPREINLQPGMLFDDLLPGEEVGLIDSNRPNTGLIGFRQGQLRAVAAGIGASYSSLSKDYNGTYSAQRQEMVEQYVNYAVLTDDFTGMFVQPVWASFVAAAHLSGVVRRPPDVLPHAADDALFIGQSMPWIDPLREAKAFNQLAADGFASEVEVIRSRGKNPRDVLDQIESFRKKAKDKGLVFTSDAANTYAPAAVQPDPGAPDSAG